MSAKQITIFIFKAFSVETILENVAAKLGLIIDELPPEKKFSFQFSAQKNSGKEYLLIEYTEADNELIAEISNWERINANQKEIILNCKSNITIDYRKREVALEAITIIGQALSNISSKCIVENGFGCLLPLDTMLDCLHLDVNWTWEKEIFPELPNVAPSEWLA